jgi:hypothetical protein
MIKITNISPVIQFEEEEKPIRVFNQIRRKPEDKKNFK